MAISNPLGGDKDDATIAKSMTSIVRWFPQSFLETVAHDGSLPALFIDAYNYLEQAVDNQNTMVSEKVQEAFNEQR